MKDQKEYPYCYGKLENVFPMAENGLRCTPESCLVCYCKTECLRAAMEKSSGLKVNCYPRADKLSKQLKYADRVGINIAVLLGPDEIGKGIVTLKNL